MMDSVIKKLRKYEIRIRKAINSQMQGDFHSVFKGSGLEFDDVRAYQYGDDVRHIDWNVTAKGHGTFIKTFKEEKEQNIFFMLDVSASQNIGQQGSQKVDIGKEICGVLTLSATKEASSVGLLCFSDDKEKYVRPGKGIKHAHEILNSIFTLQPRSKKTDLNAAMKTALSILKRKSVVVLVSDFLDEGYDRHLKALARKHDLIVIHLASPQETRLLNVGIAPVEFKEEGKNIFINTSAKGVSGQITDYYLQKRQALRQLCQRNDASYLYVNTNEDFVPKLIQLFKIRNKKK